MAIVDTDWKTFLDPNSDLPTDVSFVVTGDDDLANNTINLATNNTIRAHKWPLAGVSPVFRKQFFGPMKDEREVIEVKKTSAEAFQTMVDFIYRQAGQNTFTLNGIQCPQKLFELLELAERYQIWTLVSLVKESLQNFVLTRENVMFAATVAKNYNVLFEDISTILSIGCLKFLEDTIRNSDDLFDMIGDTMKNFSGASLDILLELKRVKDDKLQGSCCIIFIY